MARCYLYSQLLASWWLVAWLLADTSVVLVACGGQWRRGIFFSGLLKFHTPTLHTCGIQGAWTKIKGVCVAQVLVVLVSCIRNMSYYYYVPWFREK